MALLFPIGTAGRAAPFWLWKIAQRLRLFFNNFAAVKTEAEADVVF
jgi:hypothetical protein